MATSHHRGHPIFFDGVIWRYSDTHEAVTKTGRACACCGKHPTPEGYDACLGELEGVQAACCGHGVEPAYTIKTEGN
jgi:hypothetical protein